MANISFHPEAVEDFAEGFHFYLADDLKAALRFEDAVDDGLQKIADSPEAWPLCDDKNHYYILKKFPFKIVYHLHEGNIVVIAVAHGKRMQDYWKKRS